MIIHEIILGCFIIKIQILHLKQSAGKVRQKSRGAFGVVYSCKSQEKMVVVKRIHFHNRQVFMRKTYDGVDWVARANMLEVIDTLKELAIGKMC